MSIARESSIREASPRSGTCETPCRKRKVDDNLTVQQMISSEDRCLRYELRAAALSVINEEIDGMSMVQEPLSPGGERKIGRNGRSWIKDRRLVHRE